jgi:hypothetical protein
MLAASPVLAQLAPRGSAARQAESIHHVSIWITLRQRVHHKWHGREKLCYDHAMPGPHSTLPGHRRPSGGVAASAGYLAEQQGMHVECNARLSSQPEGWLVAWCQTGAGAVLTQQCEEVLLQY